MLAAAAGSLVSASAYAQTVDDTAAAVLQMTPKPAAAVAAQPGKIVLYRPSALMGYAVGCPIRYKGQEIVELGRGKFAEWSIPAGSYILTNKTGSVQVVVAPGETQYIRCTIKPGFMTGRADLQIVDRETFAEHQADYAKKDVIALPAN